MIDGLRFPQPPARWLVTGAAGFIGSHLVEALLRGEQHVVGLDNFATGHRHNLDEVRRAVTRDLGDEVAGRLTFIEGDIRDVDACRTACEGVDYVLHQAALGSVPRSIEDPATSHAVNVDGFLNVLLAARDAGARRFVYASSSSVYGDHPALPKVEDAIGTPLSPYAVTKRVDELYARTVQDSYGTETVGLRYFNVFGPRQDPHGPYAAVIPKWVDALLAHQGCRIHGDGETSRDFCYVANAVEANLRAALAPAEATNRVYNVAFGERTTLNELFGLLREGLAAYDPAIAGAEPAYGPFRPGDVRHSLADVSAAREALGYAPAYSVRDGLAEALAWYAGQSHAAAPSDRL